MTTKGQWLFTELTPEERSPAELYARREDELCRDKPWAVHLGGTSLENNIVGAYGMWAVRRHFDLNQIPYEIGQWGGLFEFRVPVLGTIDVKTKRVNTQPHPNYVVDLRELHLNHQVNHFLFCYWLEPIVIILGWLEKSIFLEKAIPLKVGESNRGPGGYVFVCQEPCRILAIKHLQPFSSLITNTKGIQVSLL
ncbi:unnamed protein product [marine sediment metagenome]|uniref:Uncharacterized protein n=1 Tax=marine sediment metagenome TaxID=412755 RepID=X1FEZ6_9ZZZZ